MRKLLPLAALLLAAYLGWNRFDGADHSTEPIGRSSELSSRTFDKRDSGRQTEGSGVVIKILPDDSDGSRHQRFIVRLESGQTLLIAHNIDLAPRISSLKEGDVVVFNGEYEWNSKGGVIHWTHRDPAGRHVAGWLKHKGQTYQ